MSLQNQYRPPNLNMFAGNESIKKSMEKVLSRKNPPGSYMIVGPAGCGKTTLGRIIAKMLGCSKSEFHEMNTASDRKIDAIRAIIEDLKYPPLSGPKKIFLFDECFHENTLINTINGKVDIKDIKIGDTLFNLNGIDTVEKVFANTIPLNRVVKINKEDGTVTFCSSDHLYFVNNKWIKAKDLTNRNLLCYSRHMLCDTNYKQEVQDEMPTLSKGVYPKKENQSILFQGVCREVSGKHIQCQSKTQSNRQSDLRILRSVIPTNQECEGEEILFPKLCESLDDDTARNTGKNTQQKSILQDKSGPQKISQHNCGKKLSKQIIRENEIKQSYDESKKCSENEGNKKSKWNITHLDRKTRREWATNRNTENIGIGIGMGNRSSNKNSRSHTNWKSDCMVQKEKSSTMLQSGYREQGVENCNRDRRKKSCWEKKEIGQKENISIEMERVESVEIYQRGSNDKSFRDIIGDKERNQKYVIFYDLQMTENPSYIANNNMVHNCHQLLSGSQEALLKVLEEPPAHVHFIVCTTNPEALKDTFKRRCHIYEVELLNSITLMKHLKKILLAEKMIDYPIEILDKIVELSGGSAGIALKYLDMVVDMGKDKDEALSILKSAGACESEVIDICRALINFKVSEKSRWLRVRKLLSSFKTDGESARRPILGYLDSCLLTSDFDEGVAIALMMDEFRHNFFDNGKSGLDVACFKSCFLSGEE